MRFTVLVFPVASCRKCAPNAFSPIFERALGRVSKMASMWKGKKVSKNPFLQILHRYITVGHNVMIKWMINDQMNDKWWSKWGGSRTQQHAYCFRYRHSQHIESHKKRPQAKIPVAFLFSKLHFNNVIYGGHLVMRSKRWAVQNQRIT